MPPSHTDTQPVRVRSEWHDKPITTAHHLLTILAVLFAAASSYAVLAYRVSVSESRIEHEEARAVALVSRDAQHDSDIAVLKQQFTSIHEQLASINNKLDELTEHRLSRREPQ